MNETDIGANIARAKTLAAQHHPKNDETYVGLYGYARSLLRTLIDASERLMGERAEDFTPDNANELADVLGCNRSGTACITSARQLVAKFEEAGAEWGKLHAFKTWVHKYLDDHGVPHHPPGTHGAAGCRIGDRLDWLMATIAERDRLIAEARERGAAIEQKLGRLQQKLEAEAAERDELRVRVAALELRWTTERPVVADWYHVTVVRSQHGLALPFGVEPPAQMIGYAFGKYCNRGIDSVQIGSLVLDARHVERWSGPIPVPGESP